MDINLTPADFYDPTDALQVRIDFDSALASRSPREQQVCRLLASGQSVAAIAAALHLNRRRVKAIAVDVLQPLAREYGIDTKLNKVDGSKMSKNVKSRKNLPSVAKSDMSGPSPGQPSGALRGK